MHPAVYERYVLGACLIDPGAARVALKELPDSGFGYGPDDKRSDSHQRIFRAISALLVEGEVPDVPSVAARLGTDLSRVGGHVYLTHLTRCLGEAGIHSTQGLPQWAEVVDKVGRLRSVAQVFAHGLEEIGPVETAMERVENVDAFLADTLMQLGRANTVQLEYRPIGEAVIKAKQLLVVEARGQAVSWLPIGWPSLTAYRIMPYQSLFLLLGLSSIGKSQMLAQFLLGAAIQLKRFNIPGICVANTYEMSAQRYALRMAACISGVNLRSSAAQDETSPEFGRMMDALDFIDELPIYIDDGDMTSNQIIANARFLEAQFDRIHVIGIDYSELVPDRSARGSEEQRVTQIFRNAQRLARMGPGVVIVSQFSSAVNQDDTKLGINCIPRYSGGGHHAADLQGIVYNPPEMRRMRIDFKLPEGMSQDHAYLVITKNKEGAKGTVQLNWTAGCTRFADPGLVGYGMSMLYEGIDEVREQITSQRAGEGDF